MRKIFLFSLFFFIFIATSKAQENTTVDCSGGPITTTFCYDTGLDNSYSFVSNDGSPLNLTIDSGEVEPGWDELVILDSDGSELYNGYGDLGNITGLSFQSTGDNITLVVQEDASISCVSADIDPITITVSCATCVNPSVDFEMVSDCLNAPQFYVDIDVTDLGSAGSLTIVDDQGSASVSISAIGTYQFGPYANNTFVQMNVTSDDDPNCFANSASITQEYCAITLVDCGVGPISNFYCYGNNDTTQFEYVSSDGSPLNLTIDSGLIEAGWDALLILDSDGVTPLFFGDNGGDITGLTFQSTGDTIYFAIQSDGSISCASGSAAYAGGIDYTVACATCTNPTAEYTVIDDCANGDQFLIDVNITSIGDAQSLTVSDNYGTATGQATQTGVVQMGPYPFLTGIVITISNDQDVNCVINSAPIQVNACPPPNDNCSGSIEAVVNTDQSCSLTTSGTLSGASPSGNASACLASADDDVWFDFVALSEVQLISLVDISGSTTSLGHALYIGTGDVDCNTLTELYCSNDTSSITPDLTPGVTYYVRVFSNGTNNENVDFELCVKDAPDNTSCENASNFCGEGGALYGSNIFDFPSLGQIACLYTTPNPSWNILQIGESGTIDIQIVQNTQFDDNGNATGAGLDVDFVLWGPFDSSEDFCEPGVLDQGCPDPFNCPNNTSNPNFYPYGNIVDCSYSIYSVENLTIENAVNGEIYVLLVTNYSNNSGIIQIQQTNAGQTGAGSTIASIEVDLGGDQDLCGYPNYELNANSPFADYYEWYQDGVIISDANESTLQVTDTANYSVIVYDQQCSATAEDSVTINFYSEATANQVEDLITCDDSSADEVEDFDLNIVTSDILGAQDSSEFVVTYFLSISDAQNNINPISSPYTNVSNPQTIYARVEHINAVGSSSGCFATTSFDLFISGPTPDALSPGEIIVCTDQSEDGIEVFNLAAQDDVILNGQDSELFDISYYLSEEDALNSNNPLDPIIENSTNPQTIYARVESNQAYDCYSITSFDLAVCQIPEGISPNGDGYNDTFILNGYNVNTLYIYNRYGKVVYNTNNYNNDWAGQSNEGKKLPVGTYFYHMIYDDNLQKTGWVYLNY
jgi:gliding motility-associated-like protein